MTSQIIPILLQTERFVKTEMISTVHLSSPDNLNVSGTRTEWTERPFLSVIALWADSTEVGGLA